MKIGFIGVGIIASHMVEGFCGLNKAHEFYLSPRNTERAACLAGKYRNVTVCGHNQEVVDSADLVFITLLPKDCLEVISGLRFRSEQDVINVTASVTLSDIGAAAGPVRSLSHIVPLPFISARTGPIAAYPESGLLKELLSPLGTVVFMRNMDEMRAAQAITSLMSPFYEILHRMVLFAESQGMQTAEATAYTTSFFRALCGHAMDFKEGSLHELAMEMTPGGLNELAYKTLTASGAIDQWGAVLGPIIEKIGVMSSLNSSS
ncbi:MAG: NAD(P)-binding domain-containing protein [Clostridiales bacterium]|jgi:pyrroline-5-carboxylate reductase|nr:NAD(P)-binding domain-containing protein [Clostridiales bacterium]